MDFAGLAALVAALIVDTAFSWMRMFAALAISVVVSIAVGIYAATHRKAEKIVLPLVDVLQTLPILAFFPFAIFIIVDYIPGAVGVNIAVIFLIITSMVWNIIFGVYESIKTLPKEYTELSRLYRLGRWDRLRKIHIPAAMPRVVEQSVLSWSIGLFYLVTSEIFSTGSSRYAVKYGIGAAMASSAITSNALSYAIALGIFVAFVIGTRMFFFKPWEEYVTKHNRHTGTQSGEIRNPLYSREIGERGVRLFRRLRAIRLVKAGERIVGRRITGNRRKHDERWLYDDNEGGGGMRMSVVKYTFFSVVALAAVYVVATHTYLIGYERTVLYALALSFGRVWLAFAISLSIGIPLCVYIIFITKHSSKYLLLFQIISSIPATILLPAIASSLRSFPHHGEIVALIVFVLSSIWYVIFSVMNMVRTLPSSLPEVKDVFGVKGTYAWRKIYLRAIVPGLITGGITAIAAEWNASIVAEYFTIGNNVVAQVGTGIGRLLDLSLGGGNLTLMLVALVNLTLMIIILNTFVWKRLYRGVSRIYS